ncbi:hypothetical protein CC86DRAFT_374798 [Ophiobolus disseminans]|uniref:Exosome complex protein n=1 Tax=Ophiobolus disseminans TaxID=1469910 RepID=A0A6A6ZG76_9PLEO|nr:hypothetical protein CC86DRAFT_374798 [Ophiobolus disseminans]
MDPQTDLPDLVEDLEVNIDELSDILSPLLSTPLSTTASSLPLLDKAKLYVLAAYSVESLLYSSLQASGVNAKEHAIFKELGRLRGYFGKIKDVEGRAMPPSAPKTKLDVGAAARFIQHGLAGNDKYDLERAERMAKEKARAQLKARQINKKFDEDGVETAKVATPKKRDAEDMEVEEPVKAGDGEVLEGLEEPEARPVVAQPAPKRQRISVAAGPMDVDSASSPASSQSQPDGKKKTRRSRRDKKKTAQSAEPSEADPEPEVAADLEQPVDSQPDPEPSAPAKPAKKKKGKKKSKSVETSEAEDPAASEPSQPDPEPESQSSPPKKKQRNTRSKAKAADETEEEEATTPARVPKTRSETFNALLDGSVPEKAKKARGRPPKVKK